MKNILVLMHDDAGQEARFQAALDVSRAIDGHLICVDVSIEPVFVGDYADCGGTALLMQEETARETQNRARMEARLKVEGLPYDWIDETGFLNPAVRDSAAMADLVVLNRELDRIAYPHMRSLAGEVLIKAQKPVLAVPESSRGLNLFGNVLVGWDGSTRAEAALRAAVPLLRHASGVMILEVDDGSLKLPAEAAAEYLSRHDIRPVIRRERALLERPETVILSVIPEIKAGYLVMGGFGHSRMMEAAFGGVTQHMLKASPIPLFLAH